MTSIVAPAATLTGTYSIDPASSTIGFAARGAVGKVRGTFNDFSGTGYFDAEDPTRSHVELTIRAGSVDTRDVRRDQHLRNADFFAVDEFPEIRFVSTTVESMDPWSQRVTGDLTIKAITRPITVDFELAGAVDDPFGNQRIAFQGAAVLNRKDWDVTWNQTLDSGGVLMGNKVTLEFEISAVRAADES